jgi:hypothetical protein
MPPPTAESPFMADPYDDACPEAGPLADDAPGLDAVLPALWTMLARPEVGAASTLPALRLTLADRLVDALRRRHSPFLDLATALADMLTLGARDAARFPEPARGACREAVERLMLAFDASFERGHGPRGASADGLAPLVVAALASGKATRQMRGLLDPIGVAVLTTASADEAVELLTETPAELILTERGVFDAAFTAVRRLPLHGRTPILAFCGPELPPSALAALARETPGVRWMPRPTSRAEFVLQVRLSLLDT